MTDSVLVNGYSEAMILARNTGCLIFLLLVGCAGSNLPEEETVVTEEFVGTTPCDALSREFLGGLDTNAPCHCVTWHLTLFPPQKDRQRAIYTLMAKYGLPGRNDPNQIEDGPTVTLKGKWETTRGHKANPQAIVYRIYRDNAEETMSLGRIGGNVFHFLDRDRSLMIGNAGWSYTLNRKGVGREN